MVTRITPAIGDLQQMFKLSKIIVADDHPLFRDALQNAIVQGFGDIAIVGVDSFSSLQDATRQHHDCDLILLDLMMPGAVGFSALSWLGLRCPLIPVVVISGNDDSTIVARALDYGAMAFVPKSTQLPTMIEAIESVLAGDTWLPNEFTPENDENTANRQVFADRVSQLTVKQFRVLMMLADGHQNKHIAADLCVSEATVKAHLTVVYQKLGVQNRTQAATLAAQHLKIDREEFLQP